MRFQVEVVHVDDHPNDMPATIRPVDVSTLHTVIDHVLANGATCITIFID